MSHNRTKGTDTAFFSITGHLPLLIILLEFKVWMLRKSNPFPLIPWNFFTVRLESLPTHCWKSNRTVQKNKNWPAYEAVTSIQNSIQCVPVWDFHHQLCQAKLTKKVNYTCTLLLNKRAVKTCQLNCVCFVEPKSVRVFVCLCMCTKGDPQTNLKSLKRGERSCTASFISLHSVYTTCRLSVSRIIE